MVRSKKWCTLTPFSDVFRRRMEFETSVESSSKPTSNQVSQIEVETGIKSRLKLSSHPPRIFNSCEQRRRKKFQSFAATAAAVGAQRHGDAHPAPPAAATAAANLTNQIGGASLAAPPRSYRPTSTPQIDRLSPLYLRASRFFNGRFTSEMSSTLCVVVRRRPAGQASNRRALTGFEHSKELTYLPQKKYAPLHSAGRAPDRRV